MFYNEDHAARCIAEWWEVVNSIAWVESHRGQMAFRIRLRGEKAGKARATLAQWVRRGALKRQSAEVFQVRNDKMPKVQKPVKIVSLRKSLPKPTRFPSWYIKPSWWLPKHGDRCWCAKCNPAPKAA